MYGMSRQMVSALAIDTAWRTYVLAPPCRQNFDQAVTHCMYVVAQDPMDLKERPHLGSSSRVV